MPPQLAALIYGALIVWLLVRDAKANPDVSRTLWIPLIWMLICGTKSVTEWVYGNWALTSSDAYAEGSALDRNVFILLIFLGLLTLLSRKVSWQSFLASNWAVSIFFFYSLLSVTWSDFPVTAFKRWYKVLGHLIMALVVYSERKPTEAFSSLFKRCGYILIPLSVLYIKYYPNLGRGFDSWTGAAVNVGVTNNKNTLGNLCMVIGLFFLASLFTPAGKRLVSGIDRYITIAFLAMIVWLLHMAENTDASASAFIGAATIVGLQTGFIRRNFSKLLIIGCLVAGVFITFPDLKDSVILALGEDSTLTGRTDLWKDLDAIPKNPILGAGFESFWLGDRLDVLWKKYWWHPNQAHNGYFETYLNLGLIGLALLGAMILSCYFNVRKEELAAAPAEGPVDLEGNRIAQFKLAFLLALVAFNSTDTTFKATHLSFFVFFVVALQYAPQVARTVQSRFTPVRAPHVSQHFVPGERMAWAPMRIGQFGIKKGKGRH